MDEYANHFVFGTNVVATGHQSLAVAGHRRALAAGIVELEKHAVLFVGRVKHEGERLFGEPGTRLRRGRDAAIRGSSYSSC